MTIPRFFGSPTFHNISPYCGWASEILHQPDGFSTYEYWDVYHQLVQDFAGSSTVQYMPRPHTHVVMVPTD